MRFTIANGWLKSLGIFRPQLARFQLRIVEARGGAVDWSGVETNPGAECPAAI